MEFEEAPKESKPLVIILSTIACFMYAYGVYIACAYSLEKTTNSNGETSQTIKDIAPILHTTILSLAAVFSANLGALLGKAIAKPGSYYADTKNWRIWNVILNLFQNTIYVRILAAYFYIISLVACCVVYGINHFDAPGANYTVPLVQQLAVSFLGVLTVALGLALNVETK